MNVEFGKMCNKTTMSYFKILLQGAYGEAKHSHEKKLIRKDGLWINNQIRPCPNIKAECIFYDVTFHDYKPNILPTSKNVSLQFGLNACHNSKGTYFQPEVDTRFNFEVKSTRTACSYRNS